jgi:hypothetical protein
MLAFALVLTLNISRVTHPPTLDDFESAGMTRVEGFLDRIPTNLAPISEETVAHVGYDDSALYIIFVAHESSAAQTALGS